MNRKPWRHSTSRAGNRGAAMVEFAIVVVLFMLLIMGGLEFGRMIFEWGRMVEATRTGVRTAVVAAPPSACLDKDDKLDLTCPDGSCGPAEPDEDSPVLLAMQSIFPSLAAENVALTYTCSGTGFEDRPTPIPVITVEVHDVNFEPVVPGLLGIPATIPIPGFASSQTGEAMEDF